MASLNPQSGPVYIDFDEYLLRSLTPEDIDERVLSWLSDTDMLSGLNISSFGFDLKRFKDFIAAFNNKTHYFIGIFLKKEELLIGFYTIDVSFPHMVAYLTMGIGDKEFEGKFIAQKTINALLDYFFKYRKIHKFTARVLDKNYRMIFNLRKAQRFKLEAILEEECITPSGGRSDILVFSAFCNRKNHLSNPTG